MVEDSLRIVGSKRSVGFMEKKIINLTPHTVTLVCGNKTVDIQPSGQVARVSATSQEVGSVEIDGYSFPVVRTVFGDVQGLPEPAENTIYIVSTLVLSAAQGRNDLVAPNTGAAIRDADGKIVGVPGFQVL